MKLKRFLVEAGVAGARDCANKDQAVRLALQNSQLDFAALHADVTVQRAAEARALEERKAREAAAAEAVQRANEAEAIAAAEDAVTARALRPRYSRSRLVEYVSAHVTALIDAGFGAYPGDQGDCLRQEGLGFVILQSHERSSSQSVRRRLGREGAVEYMVQILDVALGAIVRDGAAVAEGLHAARNASWASVPSVAAVRALMVSMAAQEQTLSRDALIRG